MELGAIPIINENDTVATKEIVIGDNDTLAAIVAQSVKADKLILLSDIDGLYTADPHKDPNAKLIQVAHEIDDKGQEREMQHPFRCRNTGRIYGHLILYEPQSDRLGNKNHNCGQSPYQNFKILLHISFKFVYNCLCWIAKVVKILKFVSLKACLLRMQNSCSQQDLQIKKQVVQCK